MMKYIIGILVTCKIVLNLSVTIRNPSVCRTLKNVYQVCKESEVLTSVKKLNNFDINPMELFISDIGISSIAPNAFKELPIKKLGLELGDDMLDLEPNSFSGLPMLIELRIISTTIHLEENLFKKINSLNYLQLKINGTNQTFYKAFIELPNLRHLDIVESKLGYLGPEKFYKINNWISHLLIRNSDVKLIKTNSFTDFNNLTQADFVFNGIRTIQPGAFNRLNMLKVLSLRVNEITSISKNIFNNLSELIDLDLSHNNINSINIDAFINTNIINLSLNNNKLKILNFGIFNQLIDLRVLQLQNNLINKITNQTFNGLTLGVLNLSNNSLSILSIGMFDGLIVNKLDLSFNKIIKIQSGAFESIIVNTLELWNVDIFINKTECGLLKSVQVKQQY